MMRSLMLLRLMVHALAVVPCTTMTYRAYSSVEMNGEYLLNVHTSVTVAINAAASADMPVASKYAQSHSQIQTQAHDESSWNAWKTERQLIVSVDDFRMTEVDRDGRAANLQIDEQLQMDDLQWSVQTDTDVWNGTGTARFLIPGVRDRATTLLVALWEQRNGNRIFLTKRLVHIHPYEAVTDVHLQAHCAMKQEQQHQHQQGNTSESIVPVLSNTAATISGIATPITAITTYSWGLGYAARTIAWTIFILLVVFFCVGIVATAIEGPPLPQAVARGDQQHLVHQNDLDANADPEEEQKDDNGGYLESEEDEESQDEENETDRVQQQWDGDDHDQDDQAWDPSAHHAPADPNNQFSDRSSTSEDEDGIWSPPVIERRVADNDDFVCAIEHEQLQFQSPRAEATRIPPPLQRRRPSHCTTVQQQNAAFMNVFQPVAPTFDDTATRSTISAPSALSFTRSAAAPMAALESKILSEIPTAINENSRAARSSVPFTGSVASPIIDEASKSFSGVAALDFSSDFAAQTVTGTCTDTIGSTIEEPAALVVMTESGGATGTIAELASKTSAVVHTFGSRAGAQTANDTSNDSIVSARSTVPFTEMAATPMFAATNEPALGSNFHTGVINGGTIRLTGHAPIVSAIEDVSVQRSEMVTYAALGSSQDPGKSNMRFMEDSSGATSTFNNEPSTNATGFGGSSLPVGDPFSTSEDSFEQQTTSTDFLGSFRDHHRERDMPTTLTGIAAADEAADQISAIGASSIVDVTTDNNPTTDQNVSDGFAASTEPSIAFARQTSQSSSSDEDFDQVSPIPPGDAIRSTNQAPIINPVDLSAKGVSVSMTAVITDAVPGGLQDPGKSITRFMDDISGDVSTFINESSMKATGVGDSLPLGCDSISVGCDSICTSEESTEQQDTSTELLVSDRDQQRDTGPTVLTGAASAAETTHRDSTIGANSDFDVATDKKPTTDQHVGDVSDGLAPLTEPQYSLVTQASESSCSRKGVDHLSPIPPTASEVNREPGSELGESNAGRIDTSALVSVTTKECGTDAAVPALGEWASGRLAASVQAQSFSSLSTATKSSAREESVYPRLEDHTPAESQEQEARQTVTASSLTLARRPTKRSAAVDSSDSPERQGLSPKRLQYKRRVDGAVSDTSDRKRSRSSCEEEASFEEENVATGTIQITSQQDYEDMAEEDDAEHTKTNAIISAEIASVANNVAILVVDTANLSAPRRKKLNSDDTGEGDATLDDAISTDDNHVLGIDSDPQLFRPSIDSSAFGDSMQTSCEVDEKDERDVYASFVTIKSSALPTLLKTFNQYQNGKLDFEPQERNPEARRTVGSRKCKAGSSGPTFPRDGKSVRSVGNKKVGDSPDGSYVSTLPPDSTCSDEDAEQNRKVTASISSPCENAVAPYVARNSVQIDAAAIDGLDMSAGEGPGPLSTQDQDTKLSAISLSRTSSAESVEIDPTPASSTSVDPFKNCSDSAGETQAKRLNRYSMLLRSKNKSSGNDPTDELHFDAGTVERNYPVGSRAKLDGKKRPVGLSPTVPARTYKQRGAKDFAVAAMKSRANPRCTIIDLISPSMDTSFEVADPVTECSTASHSISTKARAIPSFSDPVNSVRDGDLGAKHFSCGELNAAESKTKEVDAIRALLKSSPTKKLCKSNGGSVSVPTVAAFDRALNNGDDDSVEVVGTRRVRDSVVPEVTLSLSLLSAVESVKGSDWVYGGLGTESILPKKKRRQFPTSIRVNIRPHELIKADLETNRTSLKAEPSNDSSLESSTAAAGGSTSIKKGCTDIPPLGNRRKCPPAVVDVTSKSFMEGRTSRSAASRGGIVEPQRATKKSCNASEADGEKPRAPKRRMRPAFSTTSRQAAEAGVNDFFTPTTCMSDLLGEWHFGKTSDDIIAARFSVKRQKVEPRSPRDGSAN